MQEIETNKWQCFGVSVQSDLVPAIISHELIILYTDNTSILEGLPYSRSVNWAYFNVISTVTHK